MDAMTGPAGTPHHHDSGQHPPKGRKGNEPSPIPPLHPCKQRKSSPGAAQPKGKRDPLKHRISEDPEREGDRHVKGRIGAPVNR